ncbi:hypothetical protein RAA17_12615 [Komagataeibacter rhaeticus]|nr:hypothetical protein [Komagataeibacter rhaeticus]
MNRPSAPGSRIWPPCWTATLCDTAEGCATHEMHDGLRNLLVQFQPYRTYFADEVIQDHQAGIRPPCAGRSGRPFPFWPPGSAPWWRAWRGCWNPAPTKPRPWACATHSLPLNT